MNYKIPDWKSPSRKCQLKAPHGKPPWAEQLKKELLRYIFDRLPINEISVTSELLD